MKKILLVAIASLSIFSAVACGNKNKKTTAKVTTTNKTTQTTAQITTTEKVFTGADLLVNNAVDNWAKTTLKTKLESFTNFTGSEYWYFISYSLLKDYCNYETVTFTNELKDAISSCDTTTLTGANLGKYYYAAKAVGADLTNFKVQYQSEVEKMDSYGSEYVTPFVITYADSLDLVSCVSSAVVNDTYRATTDWGTDGLAWQLTSLAAFKTLDSSEFLPLNFTNLESSYSKDTSLALYILPYAASNISAKTIKLTETSDIVSYLVETYYDIKEKKFETEKLGESDYSSEQIYAALIAYQIQRDTNKAVNIFA